MPPFFLLAPRTRVIFAMKTSSSSFFLVFTRSSCVLRRDWSTGHRDYEKSTLISAEHEIYLLVNVKKMLKCQPLLAFQYL